MSETKELTLEEVEAKRAERRAALTPEFKKQRARDMAALDDLEESLGDSNVGFVDMPFTPGLPTMLIVQCPSALQMKAFKQKVSPKGGRPVDYTAEQETLAKQCRVYPPKDEAGNELFERVLSARPGVLVLAGKVASNLASGSESEDSK